MKTPKTIKFSLPLQKPDKDGRYPVVRVNSLEELRDNFDPHGLLYALKTNSLLIRWLEVRGYADEKAQIEEMLSQDLSDDEQVKRMAKIFRLDVSDEELDALLKDIELMERRREVVQQQTVQENDILSTCKLRYQQYLSLIKKITDNATDLGVINNILQEMKSRFPELLELNHSSLFDVLLDKAPLAVLAMLADKDLRPYYLDYDFMGKPYDKNDRPFSHDFAEIFPLSAIEDKFRPSFFEQLKSKFIPIFSDRINSFRAELGKQLGRSVDLAIVTEKDNWQTLVNEDTKIICFDSCVYHNEDDELFIKFGDNGYFSSANVDTKQYNTDCISTRSSSRCFTILNGLQATRDSISLNYCIIYVKLN